MNTRRLVTRLRGRARKTVDRTGVTARDFRRRLERAAAPRERTRHVLVAPPGAGNIGDQAMVEAYLTHAVDRPVAIVTRGEDDFTIPTAFADRVTVVPLPDLLYGAGAAHRADTERMAAILDTAATVSIVGADIMDGVYVLRASVRRAALAEAAARAGADTTILGFSWNAAAPSAALSALRAAGDAGARLMLRDPASAERVRSGGVRGVVDTADIVFTDPRVNAEGAAAVLADVSGPYALLNASGLVARKVDQVPEYAAVIAELRRREVEVILLPHVLRSTADDLAECRRILAAVDQPGVHLVDHALSPSTIRALAEGASITVTGRMHLAIMSLSQGTPAVTLATQGKVEGLMRLVDWPQLCVTPRPGMGEEIVGVVSAALDDPASSQRVLVGADRARALAAANIAHLSGEVTAR